MSSANLGNGQAFSYTYDRYGNRWAQNVTAGSGPTWNVAFNSQTNQVVGYTYDAAGNVSGDGTHSYQYDAEGNLVSVDGGSTATYTYDSLNRRVQTDVGGASANFVFDTAGQPVSIWDGNDGHEYEGEAYWGARPFEFYASGAADFEHQNWLGTDRVVTGPTGAVAGTYDSLPFGEAGPGSAPPPHFAELDLDPETATNHAPFRQYSPGAGRWMSPDPYSGSYDFSNPQSLNRYSYAVDNPVTFNDPSGLVTNNETCNFLCQLFEDGLEAAGDGLLNLFGFGGSGFHGSLLPRPEAWGSFVFQVNVWQAAEPFVFKVYALPRGGTAPSNGTQVSATPPKKSPYTKKYSDYAASAIAGLFDPDADRSLGVSSEEPSTFVVVNTAFFLFKNPIRKIIATGVAVYYDLNLAITNRERCVQQVYGPGYF